MKVNISEMVQDRNVVWQLSLLFFYCTTPWCVYAVLMCLSVTSQCSTEMAKRRITQTVPHDSPRTQVLLPKISAKLNAATPNRGNKCRWDRLKLATFDKLLCITRNCWLLQAMSTQFGHKFITMSIQFTFVCSMFAGSSATAHTCLI